MFQRFSFSAFILRLCSFVALLFNRISVFQRFSFSAFILHV